MEERLLPRITTAPMCSVLIVNYNYERFLGAAIESALQQSYHPLEIIVCDDGSTDGSRELISRYAAADSRIKPIFKQNAAVAAALNDAFRASSGEIITMLDADDLFEKEKVARVVERFRSGGRIGMVLNALRKIDSDGREIGRIPQIGRFERGELRDAILQSAGHFSAAPTSGISMRRECAERVFPIPETEFRTEADGYMRSIAALYYAVDVIDEPLTVYRVHSSNVTAATSVDLKWANRAISAARRIHAAISAVAAKEGWAVAPLERNFGYCEAVAVKNFLERAGRTTALRDVQHLTAAAKSVAGADRSKVWAKAAMLSAAILAPYAVGKRMIDAIYLPNPLKRLVG
jgi:glycosyltransferase involved in cell wall biosynthesis